MPSGDGRAGSPPSFDDEDSAKDFIHNCLTLSAFIAYMLQWPERSPRDFWGHSYTDQLIQHRGTVDGWPAISFVEGDPLALISIEPDQQKLSHFPSGLDFMLEPDTIYDETAVRVTVIDKCPDCGERHGVEYAVFSTAASAGYFIHSLVT